MMTYEAWIHPESFVSIPHKHVYVPPKELYQFFLLLRGQLSFDLKELLWVIIITFSKSSHFISLAVPSVGNVGPFDYYKPLSVEAKGTTPG